MGSRSVPGRAVQEAMCHEQDKMILERYDADGCLTKFMDLEKLETFIGEKMELKGVFSFPIFSAFI